MEARSEEVPARVDAPSPAVSGLESLDIKAIDFANASASGPSQRPGEGESPSSGAADPHSLERAPSRLPKDRLGLIDEIKQDLAEWDILHSTDGAEMDDKGHVDVTMAPPEDVQRNRMEPVPLPSPDEDEGNEIRVAQFGAKSPER